MALASMLGSGVRPNILCFTGRRLAPQLLPRKSYIGKARSFSLLLQPSTPSRNCRHLVLSSSTRNFTKPSTASPPAEPAASNAVPNDNKPPAVESAATEVASNVEVPIDPSGSEVLPDFINTAVANLPPALQFGDLAALGLVGWTPAGLVRWSLEVINVGTGLPWFWTLVVGSVFWRIVLVPVVIKSLRNSARILPLQPQITAYQEEMNRIRMTKDKFALQRHALKMQKMYKDAGVNMGIAVLAPFVQLPVTLGLFFGVKKMCELPVVQMAHSGLGILPDLTVPDPYMILPILVCAAVNLQIHVGAAEMNLQERPEIGHVMNGLRALTLVGAWVMSSFPSGLMVSLLTTSLATTVQSYVLQQPSVRKAFDIPFVPAKFRGALPSPKSTLLYLRDTWRNKMEEANAIAKQRPRKR